MYIVALSRCQGRDTEKIGLNSWMSTLREPRQKYHLHAQTNFKMHFNAFIHFKITQRENSFPKLFSMSSFPTIDRKLIAKQ